VLSHTLFAPPGPPLPHLHPSPALLAKLYLHISSLYTSARASFKVHGTEPSSKKLFTSDRDEADRLEGDITPSLKRYLRKESLLASALAHKWLGVDAGENGKGAKVGEAIAWMKEAKIKLAELEDSAVREKMKGLGVGRANERKKEERRSRKGRVERELEDVGAWLRAYTKMNDTVGLSCNMTYDDAEGEVGIVPAYSTGVFSYAAVWTTDLWSETVQASCCQVWAGTP